jgi:hypothetical protein
VVTDSGSLVLGTSQAPPCKLTIYSEMVVDYAAAHKKGEQICAKAAHGQ